MVDEFLEQLDLMTSGHGGGPTPGGRGGVGKRRVLDRFLPGWSGTATHACGLGGLEDGRHRTDRIASR